MPVVTSLPSDQIKRVVKLPSARGWIVAGTKPQHGEYRTKRVILEIYDEMAAAMRTGEPYQHPPRPAARRSVRGA